MRTRSQGPPESPSIERDTNPFPNPDQIAKDQAEAVRLASIATGREGGTLATNTQSTPGSNTDSSEIPPINTINQIEEGVPQNTGENSPNSEGNLTDGDGGRSTGEIPPE